jgi:hypothetical protein
MQRITAEMSHMKPELLMMFSVLCGHVDAFHAVSK